MKNLVAVVLDLELVIGRTKKGSAQIAGLSHRRRAGPYMKQALRTALRKHMGDREASMKTQACSHTQREASRRNKGLGAGPPCLFPPKAKPADLDSTHLNDRNKKSNAGGGGAAEGHYEANEWAQLRVRLVNPAEDRQPRFLFSLRQGEMRRRPLAAQHKVAMAIGIRRMPARAPAPSMPVLIGFALRRCGTMSRHHDASPRPRPRHAPRNG